MWVIFTYCYLEYVLAFVTVITGVLNNYIPNQNADIAVIIHSLLRIEGIKIIVAISTIIYSKTKHFAKPKIVLPFSLMINLEGRDLSVH